MSNPYVIHVYPGHQGEPTHDTDHNGACWCEPTPQHDGQHEVWIHRRVN